MLVGAAGDVRAHYRKHFLYATDEAWAAPGAAGFFAGELAGRRLAIGICARPPPVARARPPLTAAGMDLNPHRFAAPFDAYEFGTHVVAARATLAVVPMNWLAGGGAGAAAEPEEDTLRYWAQRMLPAVARAAPSVLVACNRVGVERGVAFAGSSAVLGLGGGRVRVYGAAGRGTEELLVCDVPDAA